MNERNAGNIPWSGFFTDANLVRSKPEDIVTDPSMLALALSMPGMKFRINTPGYGESRGYVDDDGALVIVGAEGEEDDEHTE